MITFEHSGSFKNTERFLKRMSDRDMFKAIQPFAREGVAALAANTPVDSGLTSASWGYEIRNSRGSVEIIWTNTNAPNGAPIAIMLQLGHGTGTGGYVRGRDYINPAMAPIFDKIAEEVWKVVTTA